MICWWPDRWHSRSCCWSPARCSSAACSLPAPQRSVTTLRDWHRLFGLFLLDYFTGSPFDVEIESDLSLQQQFLDVIIVRRRIGNKIPPLPDGMEILNEHNLITFKSHHETLDSWAIQAVAC